MATRKGPFSEFEDIPELKPYVNFKLPWKVRLQVMGRFLALLAGAAVVAGAAVIAVVLFFHGTDDPQPTPPAPTASSSASAPKTADPSFRSLDPSATARFGSFLASCFEHTCLGTPTP